MKDPAIGKEIDGYRIIEMVGRGGMGIVYRARHVELKLDRALKVIDPALARDTSFVRRFRSEARALARIDSPFIVRLHDLRTTEIGLTIVMEYVEGGTLKDRIEEGPMAYEKGLPIVRQTLRALEDAHGADVIHRDIKPHNILLTRAMHVKMTDFGLAKINKSGDPNRTVTRGVYGTLNYMSPEQVKGYGRVDHRSDLYSVGMTMYEMLTGRLPFDEASSEYTIMRMIVEEELPHLSRYAPNTPDPLMEIVMKALEKDRAQRYQTASEMRTAIQAFEDRQEDRQLVSGPEEKQKAEPKASPAVRGRSRRWGILLTLLVITLVAGSYVMYGPDLTSSSEPAVDVPSPLDALVDIRSVKTLESQLDDLAADRRLYYSSRASGQTRPDSCYVFVVGDDGDRVKAVLGPSRGARVNLWTGTATPGWTSQYAGYEKYWVVPLKR